MTAYVTLRADSPALRDRARDPRRLLGLDPPEGYTGRARHERLRERWRLETQHLSWLDDIVRSPSALAIAREEQALAWLSEDLREHSEGARAVVGLLRHLLGDGPEIPEGERGNRDAMRARWLTWLRERALP